jgi:hypothetical protein
MHRNPRLGWFIVVSIALAMMSGGRAGVLAQEATPPPHGIELAPGVTAEEMPPLPDQPTFYRLRLAPGSSFTGDDTDPTISLVYVEAGIVRLTFGAPTGVSRAAATPTPIEPVAAGTEFVVHPGDYFIAPGHATVEVHNDGPEPASLLVAALLPTSAAAGTPVR